MPGLFGNIDAAEIPDDPFWVDNGKYFSVVESFKNLSNEEKGTHAVVIRFQIQEPDSDFDGQRVDDYKVTYPNLTEEDLEAMEPETRANCKRDLSRLRQRFTQIGVTEEDMNNWDDEVAEQYVGTEVYITVKNNADKDDPSKNYRNVTFVELATPEDE